MREQAEVSYGWCRVTAMFRAGGEATCVNQVPNMHKACSISEYHKVQLIATCPNIESALKLSNTRDASSLSGQDVEAKDSLQMSAEMSIIFD